MRSGVLLLLTSAGAGPQSDTRLLLRVEPEAALNVSTVALRLSLPEGHGQTETLLARARPLPNQRVILTANPGDLTSGQAVIPRSEIRWAGTKTAARGGGEAAACTSGGPSGSGAQTLATGWIKPGTLTCSVVFSVADPGRYPPGVYTGTVLLDLKMQ